MTKEEISLGLSVGALNTFMLGERGRRASVRHRENDGGSILIILSNVSALKRDKT